MQLSEKAQLTVGSALCFRSSEASHTDVFRGWSVQTLEPSARVPVCSCGAVKQANPAKRVQSPGTEPGNSAGKHSSVAADY